jgi:phage head maturation protease
VQAQSEAEIELLINEMPSGVIVRHPSYSPRLSSVSQSPPARPSSAPRPSSMPQSAPAKLLGYTLHAAIPPEARYAHDRELRHSPTCFLDSTYAPDIVLTLNHDRSQPAASTRAGTLRVAAGPSGGLVLLAHLLDVPVGREIVRAATEGLGLSGLSIGCERKRVLHPLVFSYENIVDLSILAWPRQPAVSGTRVILDKGLTDQWAWTP